MEVINEGTGLMTNVRGHVLDVDQVSGYPSDGQSANVSKETTTREIVDIDGVDKNDFKNQNMNILFGKVNTIEYTTNMMNFPQLPELNKRVMYLIEKEKETLESAA